MAYRRWTRLLLALIALTSIANPDRAAAGTISQVDELRARLNRALWLLDQAKKDGNLVVVQGLESNVLATTALLRRCEAMLNGVTPDSNYTEPVDLSRLPDPAMYLGTEAQYTGATQVDVTPDFTAAVEDHFAENAELAYQLSAFDLAAARVLGALNANDLAAAQARLAELQTIFNAAVPAVQAALAGWITLRDAMIDIGANLTFGQADAEAYRQSLINDGLMALPDGFASELSTHLGIDASFFESTMLPAITAVPTATTDFLSDIGIYVTEMSGLEAALQDTLDSSTSMVPEPTTGLLLALGLAGLVLRSRAARRAVRSPRHCS